MSRRRRGHSRSFTRDSVSLIFGFFLSLALLGIMVITVIRLGVMTWGGFTYIVDDEYYELTLKYIEEETNHYTLPTGIDPSVLDGVFDVEEVKQQASSVIAGALDGSGYKPNTKAVRDRLTKNVQKLFTSDNVKLEEGNTAYKIVDGYVNDIMAIYDDAIVMPGLDAVVQIRDVYGSYYPVALVCLVALAALMIILIMRLHHFAHRAMRYVAYATGGAALMGFVVPCILYFSGFYKGLNLRPEFFYHFGVSLVQHVLRLCMVGSAALLLIMFIEIFAIGRMRGKAMHKGRLRHAS